LQEKRLCAFEQALQEALQTSKPLQGTNQLHTANTAYLQTSLKPLYFADSDDPGDAALHNTASLVG